LGTTSFGLLWRVHIPLIRPAVIASTLLIFVECMKELPVTLMLRPINTETLSTLLYADASRGNYEESAIAALLIVAVGIIPVLLLTRTHLLGKKTK
jgi:iron(III) transport system permease protein